MSNIVILAEKDVALKQGHPVCTSQTVAARFGKLHKNVLQSIRNLHCSEEFRRLNFQPAEFIDENGDSQPMYEMTKDGLLFLAMGFTGATAARMKEAFICRFNEMEAALTRALPPGGDTVEISKDRYIELLEHAARARPTRQPLTPEDTARILMLTTAGMERREIARIVGRPVETVGTVQRRARKAKAQ